VAGFWLQAIASWTLLLRFLPAGTVQERPKILSLTAIDPEAPNGRDGEGGEGEAHG